MQHILVLILALVGVLVLLWLARLFLRWWMEHLHRLEDLRTRQAIRTFHDEKAKAIPVGLAQGASIRAAPDGSLEIVQHWHERPVESLTSVREQTTPALELGAPALPTAPTYSQIAHIIAPGRILLGYGQSGAIMGDITDLLSTAIVGRPGTGKSTMLRFVVAMLLQIGGIPLLWDPHGSIVDELGDVLQCAETGAEIEASAEIINAELDNRLAARRQGKAVTRPLLLLADEWPIISQTAPDAIQIARRVVFEGRKASMFSLIAGQGLPAQLLGGSLVRDALSSRYIFNTTPAQARMAGLDSDTAKSLLAQLDTSGPGKAILASATRRPEIVAIPSTGADDIRRLLVSGVPMRSLPRSQPVEPFPAFPGKQEVTTESLKRGLSIEEQEREQIIALANDGIPRREICTRLGKGKHYYPTVKAVLDEYERQAEMEASS